MTKVVEVVAADEMILDIGPDSRAPFADILARRARSSGTVRSACSSSMRSARVRARSQKLSPDSDAFSVAGGGDTLAAIDKYGVRDRISYISTGGGAFLEFVEGKKLPAVAMLERRASWRSGAGGGSRRSPRPWCPDTGC